jgi:hypothetical protein
MGRGHIALFALVVAVVAYLTKPQWMGCAGLPYTLDLWLHQSRHLQCEDMTLFFERPDKVVATCGNRKDGAIVRTGEPFEVCGRRFHATIGRSYPEERLRLSARVTPDPSGPTARRQ